MSRNRKQSNKGDNIKVEGKLNDRAFKQNPNWYFKDAVQADVLSRIQMNAFGALSKIGSYIQPTVCAIYANPCPGVTAYDPSSPDYFADYGPSSAGAKGVNRAAQKLWYLLTCKSGRAAGYTKSDVALLLLGMGAMIETYEFIRRVFGIAYTYNQRNRALPNMLYKAMNVDMQDYQANAADYLKRMNSLMAVMNQLPIPGNVAWFAKCQDIYQNIYMDYPAEMAQLFVISPSTTWVIEENDGYLGGSYLRTVDMCCDHSVAEDNSDIYMGFTGGGTAIYSQTDHFMTLDRERSILNPKILKYYIDVFEEQINSLLFSSTFSQIYSDILRAFDGGTLSRWSFDYIDEKYNVAPVFDDNRLWMFHNSTASAGIFSYSRAEWQSYMGPTATYDDMFKRGTPFNDVYQWGKSDVVVYNPCLYAKMISPAYDHKTHDVILDFPNDSPTTEERIEYTRYCFSNSNEKYPFPYVDTSVYTTYVFPVFSYNFNLPDHWFEYVDVLAGPTDDESPMVDDDFLLLYPASYYHNVFGSSITSVNDVDKWSKFHHFKIFRRLSNNIQNNIFPEVDVRGELTSWTRIKPKWIDDINEMIYVDLFDIR